MVKPPLRTVRLNDGGLISLTVDLTIEPPFLSPIRINDSWEISQPMRVPVHFPLPTTLRSDQWLGFK